MPKRLLVTVVFQPNTDPFDIFHEYQAVKQYSDNSIEIDPVENWVAEGKKLLAAGFYYAGYSARTFTYKHKRQALDAQLPLDLDMAAEAEAQVS